MLTLDTQQNTLIGGHQFKRLMGGGASWLEHNQQLVNRLNVFPVPDGDTGTNMALTMRSAYRAISDLETDHVGRLSRAMADGALLGARGNSGVILSQIWAGMAKVLEPEPVLNAELLARACRKAVDTAYLAVENPVEGTILTVARRMMEAVEARYKIEPDLVSLLRRMVFAGRAAVRQTPEQLPNLKRAGVVDSGGQGLVFIFEGMLRVLCGRSVELETETNTLVHNWQDEMQAEDEEGYGYDVQFLMRGIGLRLDQVRRDISGMGWSTLVVGDDQLIKVHVHVHDPGKPLSYAVSTGAHIDDVVVENMQRQYEENLQRQYAAKENIGRSDVSGAAVIAVASGSGLRRVFLNDLGAAYVISGGQTMNPSVSEFVQAMIELKNDEIILLPNNKNVLLAAQIASIVVEKKVRVVPTLTIPQGISAMLEYTTVHDGGEPIELDELVTIMEAGAKRVRSCEITKAVGEYDLDGNPVMPGNWIGLLDDKLVVAGDELLTVARRLLSIAEAEQAERITIFFGDDVTDARAQVFADALAEQFSRQEFEIIAGGQPLYPYIISVE